MQIPIKRVVEAPNSTEDMTSYIVFAPLCDASFCDQ